MTLLDITISLAWWLWLLIGLAIFALGLFVAWNNSKESLKKKAADDLKNAGSAAAKAVSNSSPKP